MCNFPLILQIHKVKLDSHDLFPINFQFGLDSSSSILCTSLAHFSVSARFSQKNLLRKIFLYFLKKIFSNFQGKKILIFWERCIQNTSIFRTRDTFRTLVYSEPEAYSEHSQTSTIEPFAKIASWCTF